jgi:hypothetical protein
MKLFRIFDSVAQKFKIGAIEPGDIPFVSSNYDNVVEYANYAALLLNPSPNIRTLYILLSPAGQTWYWDGTQYKQTTGTGNIINGDYDGQILRWNNTLKLWAKDVLAWLHNATLRAGLYIRIEDSTNWDDIQVWSVTNPYDKSARIKNDCTFQSDKYIGTGTMPAMLDEDGNLVRSAVDAPQFLYKKITLSRNRIIGANGETALNVAGFKVFDKLGANKIIMPVALFTQCDHFDYDVPSISLNFYFGDSVVSAKFITNIWLPILVGTTQTFWGTATASYYGQGGVNEDIYVWASNTITDAGGTSTDVDILIAYIVIDITGAETMPEPPGRQRITGEISVADILAYSSSGNPYEILPSPGVGKWIKVHNQIYVNGNPNYTPSKWGSIGLGTDFKPFGIEIARQSLQWCEGYDYGGFENITDLSNLALNMIFANGIYDLGGATPWKYSIEYSILDWPF